MRVREQSLVLEIGNGPHVLANGLHKFIMGYSYYGEVRLGHLIILALLD